MRASLLARAIASMLRCSRLDACSIHEEMDERSARRNQETGYQNGLRGLSASQPRMRADTHDGREPIAPLQRPDTLMQLSRSSILEVHLVPHGRAIHSGRKQTY